MHSGRQANDDRRARRPLVLATVLPHSFRFVAGEVLEHRGLIGFVLKRLATEFIERYEREHGVADTDRVVASVRAGQSLAIFPEGRLARAPRLRKRRVTGLATTGTK